MGVVRKSITFTEPQNAFIKSLIAQGLYTNDSEYIRDLVRRDQANKQQCLALDKALQEGLDSGITDATVESIWAEAIEEYNAKQKV